MNNIDALKTATIEFDQSSKSADDYMNFGVSINVIGNNFSWPQAQIVFNECVKARNNECVEDPKAAQKAEPDNIHARIAQFCEGRLIDSLQVLVNKLAPMVVQMSHHCRHLSFEDRKPFRVIKHKFIELMHQNGMTHNITQRISKSPLGKGKTDTLIEFHIGDSVFHIPDRNQNFVNITSLEIHPEIYFSDATIPKSGIDYTFKRHMEIFKNLNSVIKFVKKEA